MTDRTRSWLGLVSAVVAFLAALFGGSYLLHQLTTTWLLMPVCIVVIILLTLCVALAYYHAMQLLGEW